MSLGIIIFDYGKKTIPDVYFIVISDMAPCIYKACRDCFGKKYSLIYRLFHLKKNFLKKFKYNPTKNLLKHLKYLMQGKISEDTFRSSLIDEKSEVEIELKDLCCLCKIAKKNFYQLI